MYLWLFIENNQQNRNHDTIGGVARECGELLHRDKLDKHMCKGCYDDPCACPERMEGETIDCRCVRITSFNQVGDDLKIWTVTYAWPNN